MQGFAMTDGHRESGDELRARLRAVRRSVVGSRPGESEARAATAAERASSLPWWNTARTVAAYRSFDGELDPGPILDALRRRRRPPTILYPVIDGDRLQFADEATARSWAHNRYGIEEPVDARHSGPTTIDLVFVPAVAVDRSGHRIGMGGGFYDRTFVGLRGLERPASTVLVGLAHDEQVVERIEPQAWDVTLDAIVTPTELILVDRRDEPGQRPNGPAD